MFTSFAQCQEDYVALTEARRRQKRGDEGEGRRTLKMRKINEKFVAEIKPSQ
jgi:hypothetical protein